LTRAFILEVAGEFACFTRPEMKVERVSYDVMTPSAARAVFESILWKPALRWSVRKVEVLTPIRWISVRRNEVGSKVSVSNVQAAANLGRGKLELAIEEDRQQRAGLFLRDVAYRIHADMHLATPEARANPVKYFDMFERRAEKGQSRPTSCGIRRNTRLASTRGEIRIGSRGSTPPFARGSHRWALKRKRTSV
jgi:CRISPR-associated protein Cas5d